MQGLLLTTSQQQQSADAAPTAAGVSKIVLYLHSTGIVHMINSICIRVFILIFAANGINSSRLFVIVLPAAVSVLLHHIPAIMATCLTLSSGHAPASASGSRRTSVDGHGNGAAPGDGHDPREEAAAEAALAVAMAADEDSLHCLVAELLKALEDVAGRALGAARLLAAYAKATRQDLQPHVDELMAVSGREQRRWGIG
jgi:hypothetical protein